MADGEATSHVMVRVMAHVKARARARERPPANPHATEREQRGVERDIPYLVPAQGPADARTVPLPSALRRCRWLPEERLKARSQPQLVYQIWTLPDGDRNKSVYQGYWRGIKAS